MKNKEVQGKVIRDMIIRLTFDGGFWRSKIYGANVSDAKRKEFSGFHTSERPKILLVIKKTKRDMRTS